MANRWSGWIQRHLPGKTAVTDKKEIAADLMPEKESSPMELMQERYGGMDRRHIWAFCAGNASQDFCGNPKYLFVYINRYRPDIRAYWYCESAETLAQVQALGFEAYDYNAPETRYVLRHTGVLVSEQVKTVIPEGMEDIVYLNLWHGVGFKRIERRLFTGDIAMGIAKKYVAKGTFYRDHQLMTVTSPMIEKEFALDCGVDADKFVRSGYLRNLYQQNYEPVVTFDHNLRARKGLDASVRMAVYAPTYRASLGDTFAEAVKDIEALYRCCEENQILLIFKVHPRMQNEPAFIYAAEVYGDRPYFWFWDNRDDFYEIMDQMDLAIVDYSSMVSDMVAMGIPHYIRYIYDFQEYIDDGLTQGREEYFERTLGTLCYTFEELLQAMSSYQKQDESAEIRRMNELFWAYSDGKADFEKVVEQTLSFEVKERTFPMIYSFDVFDTLFSRKVLEPEGVFYYVREKMLETGGFPLSLTRNYPSVRHTSEWNVREYYRKTQEIRNSDHVEIQFDEIFDRMAAVYGLSPEQTAKLKHWELECELDNVIPLTEQIERVKKLTAEGQTVVLISDMYLPKEFVKQMLEKADPFLGTLPLFLSSEYGVQKVSQKLFFEVYKSFEPFYDFEKWIHTGDSETADQRAPRRFGIQTRRVEKPAFGRLQKQMTGALATYDACLVSALQARMLAEHHGERDRFVINYVSICMVPYVDWALRDAMRRGYETLYFISRDGHPLKRIADAIIEQRKLPVKTKYIYASRRAWRIPSFIHEVDPGFYYQGHGNFTRVESKEKLLKAMDLDEETFRRFFPTIEPEDIPYQDKQRILDLVEIFRESREYNAYLLQKGAEERVLAGGYLRQEIPTDEKFAVVEYWGRGYTQDCMRRLWQDIAGEEAEVPFYYCRSTLPTEGKSVRYNFVTNDSSLSFMESIFANMPYKSVESYQVRDGRIEPVIVPVSYDRELYDSMQRLLPEFAARYAALDLRTPWDTDHMLMEFALEYFADQQTDPEFTEQVAPLVDSVAMFGNKRQYAPPYTHEDLDLFQKKVLGRSNMKITSNVSMSVTRSEKDVQERYMDMYQLLPGEDVTKGRLLSLKDQEKHRAFREKYRAAQQKAEAFAQAYDEAAERVSVQPGRILLVTEQKSMEDAASKRLMELLAGYPEADVQTLCLGQCENDEQRREAAELTAGAALIVAYQPIALFAETEFREGSREILLADKPFYLYNQGLLAAKTLKWSEKLTRYVSRNDIAVMQVPSDRQENVYRSFFTRRSRTQSILRGCNSTDIYFDPDAQTAAREKLGKLFPESVGKKVLLYLPTVKIKKPEVPYASLLEMDTLHRMLGDEYAVVIQINAEQRKLKMENVLEIPGFSRILNRGITARELLIASDLIVGEYRDVFFEAALLRKPCWSLAFDYETILRSPNITETAKEFEDLLFCPVVRTSQELAEQILSDEPYDYAKMDRFRSSMMEACDGHSTERTADYLIRQIRN